MKPKPKPMSDQQDRWFEEETQRHNDMCRRARELGLVENAPDPHPPGVEDVIGHLQSMEPAHAVAQAREWTGRKDLLTFEDAVAAVKAALNQG